MEPIISADSPFRRLPVDMSRRQILYFDALRLCAEMAGFAFKELENLLSEITEGHEGQLDERAVRAILNAYSIIDAIHRFRQLLAVTPGIKHNAAFELFMRQTKGIKDLRNIVQHINRHVDDIAREGWAALGTLTWLGPSSVPGGPPTMYILQAGTFYPGQLTYGPLVDTYSSLSKGQITDISLSTAGTRLNLSVNMTKLQTIIRRLEAPLEDFASGKERHGSDVLMKFALEPVEEDRDI